VPRTPAVTFFALIDTSRWRAFFSASVVKRNAPVSTLSVALKMPRSSTRSIWNFAFSPSLTVLPSPA
jgi:hypothetical protein